MFDRRKIRLATSFARSWLHWAALGDPRPFSASFAVTNACNLRCVYCNTPFLDRSMLPLSKIEILFDRLQRMGVVRLGLLGGEPMLRPDLPEIVAAAQARGMYVMINSNLSLYRRFADRLGTADLVMTSLDGPRAVHEHHRGKGSFEGLLEAIEDLGRRGCPVVAICVVTAANVDHLDEVLELGRRYGFTVHFQPWCSDTQIVRGEQDADDDRLRVAWERLRSARREGAPVAGSDAYFSALSRWQGYRTVARRVTGVRCAAGRGFLFVDPQGRGWPCAWTKGKVEPVDLLSESWRMPETLPCSDCIVGPMLAFNLLYRRPWSELWTARSVYL